jgi:hypothetical protein
MIKQRNVRSNTSRRNAMKTSIRPMRAAACFAALATAGVALVASPASATETQTNNVSIDAVGYDIGGSTWANGAPTSSAQVTWSQAWYGNTATLTGSLHFNRVSGNCARVRVIGYDADGSERSREYSAEECAFGNGHVVRPFAVPSVFGAASVLVTLQSEAGGTWGNLGSQTVDYGGQLDLDEVRIDRAELDLGSGEFVRGTGERPAFVTWMAEDTYVVRPTLIGAMYMKNADELCGRIRVTYFDVGDAVLETLFTDVHCVYNDDLHVFAVSAGNYADPAIARVKYTLESSPRGSDIWSAVGFVNAYLN